VQPRKKPSTADLRSILDLRFRGPLMSFFLRRVRDRSEAEDLTQDVFSRLLAKLEDGHVEDAEAFVFRVAANLLADRGRRMARRGGAPLSLEDNGAMVSGLVVRECVEDRDPERVLLGQDALQRVLAALAELNERTRDIYILFRLENIRQREIASLYGISQSTVEKEVMRATLHLAQCAHLK
jgi:RNA polymerase sigma-70 factor (ECF subfamily)